MLCRVGSVSAHIWSTPQREQATMTSDTAVQKYRTDTDPDALLLGRESEETPTISVVMPTLNEEDGIAECISRTKAAIAELGVTAEIILSDSSTDKTPEIAKSMGAIVHTPDEKGYGYAYRYAFERTRGEYIVMGDADTTYDFEQIPRLLEALVEAEGDIVLGSRLEGEIKPGAMPSLHRYIGNPVLTRFLNLFYDAGVSDAHSGFRIFTREAYDTMELRTDGMEFASEMIMEAGEKDLEMVEVPIVYHEREGEETLDSFKDGWRHVRFMLVNAPQYLFSVPGAILTLLGLFIMGSIFYTGTIMTEIFTVHLTMVGGVLMILGIQLVSFGIFTTAAGNPIRKPSDRLTTLITENITLERGVTIGIVLFTIGSVYAAWLITQWLTAGSVTVAFVPRSLLAFTLITIGSLSVFASFCLSAIAGGRCI